MRYAHSIFVLPAVFGALWPLSAGKMKNELWTHFFSEPGGARFDEPHKAGSHACLFFFPDCGPVAPELGHRASLGPILDCFKSPPLIFSPVEHVYDIWDTGENIKGDDLKKWDSASLQ